MININPLLGTVVIFILVLEPLALTSLGSMKCLGYLSLVEVNFGTDTLKGLECRRRGAAS